MASCGGRGGQLPGPAPGREEAGPRAAGVRLLSARVLLQLAGSWTPVLCRHSDEKQRDGERHGGPGSNT